MRVKPITVQEGEVAVFKMVLAARTLAPMHGRWRTVDGGATSTGANPDFEAATGDFIIDKFETTATVRVRTVNDDRYETTQNFQIVVDGTTTVGVASIVDNDPAPVIELQARAVQEGEAAVITVTVDGPSEMPVSLDWVAVANSATMAADLSPATGHLHFPVGAPQTKTLVIPTLEDLAPETPESFFVAVHRVEHARFVGAPAIVVPIIDDDLGVAPSQLSAGGSFSCVLWSDGKVRCWGNNFGGKLGNGGAHIGDEPGELGAALGPIDLGPADATTVSAGGSSFNCALLADQSVKCWGMNNWVQLGNGTGTLRGDNLGEMGDMLPSVDFGSVTTAVQLTSGDAASCALLTDGRVKCWGLNGNGELGIGDVRSRSGGESGGLDLTLPFADVGAGVPVVELGSGGRFFCARLNTGDVKCWGRNQYGQLGQGDTEDRGDEPGEMGASLPPIDLGPGRTSVEICVGGKFACARLDDFTVKCWGGYSSGALGQERVASIGVAPGEMGAALASVDFGATDTATQIACGGQHACALLTNGELKCWGGNDRGQLGLGDVMSRGGAVGQMGAALPSVDIAGSTVETVIAGGAVTCAITLEGASKVLKCWGSGKYGVLGQGHQNDVGGAPGDVAALPAIPLLGGDVTHASVSGANACAVMTDGGVRCWGRNSSGVLGAAVGNIGDEAGEVPNDLVVVDLGSSPAEALTSGETSSCARLQSEELVCWGNNKFGILGDASYETRGDNPGEMGDNLVAVDFGPERHAIQVAGGWYHRCALLDDFTVRCWGSGSRWALGTGRTGNIGSVGVALGENFLPVDLGAGRFALSVGAGAGVSCAVLDNLTVKCWGTSAGGVLGRPGVTVTAGPEAMGDHLPTIDLGPTLQPTQIHLGRHYACALRPGRGAKCWGDNDWGQLLTGDRLNRGDDMDEMGEALLPIDLGTGHRPLALSRGGMVNTVCAILADGTLKCWGSHRSGQAGVGAFGSRIGVSTDTIGDKLPAVDLGTSEPPVDIAAGLEHVCALLLDGTVKCWGQGRYGQLGLGDSRSRGVADADMGAGLPSVPLP